MGKVVKKVLKVAAFVAIATFAAPVAAAIGLSAAVGTVAGAAIVGAAAGAATNGILGGGVLNGALMGGLGGAIGGLAKVASTGTGIFGDAYAATGAVPSAATGAVTGAVEGAGAAAPAAAGAEAVFDGITVVGNTAPALISGTAATGLAAAGGAAAGLAAGGAGGGGGTPTSTGTTAPEGDIVVTGTPPPAPLVSPTAATIGTGVAGAATGAGAGLNVDSAPMDPNDPALAKAGTAPIAPAAGVGGGVSPAITAANTAGGGLLSNVGGKLLDVAKTVAPTLIAGALVPGAGGAGGDGADGGLTDPTLIDRQNQIIEDQKKAIEDAQKKYNDNFNLKTGYAQGLIDDANQYDPEVAGRRAAEAARIRAGLSARNASRGQGGRRAEIIQRQGQIEGGRDATAAYWNAYGTTGAQRTGLRSAGINAIPLGNQPSASDYSSMYTGITGQGTAADAEAARLEEERKKKVSNISGLITSGISAFTGTNTGDKAA